MKINFFNTKCKESSRTDKFFGICDKQNKKQAYTDIENEDNWVAKVCNKKEVEVVFIAIDRCVSVFKESITGEEESKCDGMLIFENSIYLVELKEKNKDWKITAKNQLKNTIRLLNEHHEDTIGSYKKKKAFGCNKKHPNFGVIDHADQKCFFDETGFRLDFNAIIALS